MMTFPMKMFLTGLFAVVLLVFATTLSAATITMDHYHVWADGGEFLGTFETGVGNDILEAIPGIEQRDDCALLYVDNNRDDIVEAYVVACGDGEDQVTFEAEALTFFDGS